MTTDVSLSLWGFSCAVYAKSGVQEACLYLQDNHCIDVPLLFFCCWSGLRYGAVSKSQLQQAASFSNNYTHVTTYPLRVLRQKMKVGYSDQWPISKQSWQVLREKIKATELESERLVLQGLERLMSGNKLKLGVTDDCIANINDCFCGLDTSIQPLQVVLITACEVYQQHGGEQCGK